MKINWLKLYDLDKLQANDFIREIKVEGKKLCIIKSGARFFATQPYCPHAGAALAHGKFIGGKLVCPYHRYEYDPETGRGNPGQGDYIDTYPVEIREDGIFVGLPAKGGLFKLLFGT